MHKRVWIAIGAVVAVLLVGAVVALIMLERLGYLPTSPEVTAALPPTSVPLPSSPTLTPSPSPVEPTATWTAQPTAEPSPTGTSTPAPPAPSAAPTRVVPPQEDVAVPSGFGVSVYADGLAGPRMMTVGPDGQLYVAERGAGRIVRLPDRDLDGVADGVEAVAAGLTSPSSIDFYQDGSLYVGETTRILRLTLAGDPAIAETTEVIIDGLPRGGHNTRTVLFSPDYEWLYVSVGSSCNVCIEGDERRAAIVRYRPDGADETVYAVGLRNAVGITFRPGTSELWATNNGRDWLGDDQPPETVYVVAEGDDAGWPRCHSGRIVDPEYGVEGACDGVLDPVVEMQAHSAPLGLGFYSGTQFPEAYRGDLFVAFHGSWNRSAPTGYKVVRVPLEDGVPGAVMDFATGWLRSDGSQWGRPVDVVTSADGSLMISDDGAGRIYRVFYTGP